MKKEALSPQARAVLGRMTEAEWKDLRNRLLYFTCRNYGAVGRRPSLPVDELVHDAIVDLLTGVRRWPPIGRYGEEKDVSLFVFLCYTIRSKASHFLEKSGREIHVGDRLGLDVVSERLLREGFQSESEEVSADRQALYSEFSKQLVEMVSGDEVLTQMVKLWVETPDLRPKEIAVILGLSIKELRNAQKRLSRRISTLKEKTLNEQAR